MSNQPSVEMHGGLTALAIKNNVTLLVLVILLSLSGIASYMSMSKQQDPGFIIRAVVVTTLFPGANPARVEELVTDQIEEVLQEIPEIDYVESESRSGISIITVNFLEKYTEMRPLFNKVRRKVNDLSDAGTLPAGASEPIINDEFGDVFGVLYALQGEGFSAAELEKIAEQIRGEMLAVDDVAKVEIHGAQDERVYIEYKGARLQELGVTPVAIGDALEQANILLSGGDIRYGRERIVLEPTGNFEDLEGLRRTVIRLPDGSVAYLGDLVTITRGYVEPVESKTRYNGEQTLVLAISLQEGGDILKMNKALDAAVPFIEASHPYGIALKKVFSQPKYVVEAIDGFMSNLWQAIAIVAGVMFAFLGIRTGIIVSLLIPSTIVVTFFCMSIFGITVNQISLAALIIALGLLVDNAIVMAEGIMIRRQGGEDKTSAAIAAGKEMLMPLLISSLTTCSAFLAIFLAESAVGEYTADIFKVVSIALIASWLLAMTFIPLMTILLMKVAPIEVEKQESRYRGTMYVVYRALLFPSLRFKIMPLIIAGILFTTALWALKFVPKVFIPERKDPVISAKFAMPRGTDIAVTEAILVDIERLMTQRFFVQSSVENGDAPQGITDILSFIGVGTPRFVLAIDPEQEDTHLGAMIIQLTDVALIPEVISAVKDYASTTYPDLEVKMRKLENGTPIDYPIEVRVTGDNIPMLYKLIGPMKKQLLATEGVMDVSDDWGMRTKKFVIKVNQERARRAGVTNYDVAFSLNTGLSGSKVTEFREGNDIIPVELRSTSADRQDLSKLDGLMVYAQDGSASVPLKQVADVELVFENGIINRRDRRRTIIVRTQHYPGVTATEIADKLAPWLEEASESWPPGYTYEMGGEMETSNDAMNSIGAKLPISGMFIFLLLMVQFNNLRKTTIILCTIPLGLIGITFGLLIAQVIFGFFTILGLISLAGIIINNAIVLIDRINIELEDHGLPPAEAVIEACQQRLRPILLTTCTTVGGMLPLWISHDPMFETMAVSIIFGLLFATLLTLILVPVLYSVFFRVDFSRLAK